VTQHPSHNELKERIRELEKENTFLRWEGDKLVRYEEQLRKIRRMIEIRHSLIEYAPSHTLDEFLTKALDEVGELVESPIGFYHFVSKDQKNLSLQQWSSRTLKEFCRAEGKGIHYSIDMAGVWVDCVHQKKPVIHNDYSSLPNKKGMPEGHAEVVRELVVPVMRKNKVVAILGVGNKPSLYKQNDVEIVSYFADVTWEIVRRKRANEALKSEKLLSEQYINSLPGLFYVFDEQARFIKWNSAWNIVTGYSDEELGERYATDFFEGEDRAIIEKKILQVFRDGFAESEAKLLTKGGRRIPYYFTGLLKKVNGRDCLIGLGIDATDRKQTEEKIREQEKIESIIQMAGTVCHELSQPLQIINGCVELLATRIPKNDKKHEKLIKILEQVERMAELTKKLRYITRYETKAYSGDTKIIDLDHSAERRKHKRFKPSKETIITSQSNAFTDGRLIDISKGGLSFYCHKFEAQKDEHLRLNIHIPGESFNLDNISCDVIASSETTGENSLAAKAIKQYKVKFREIPFDQIDQIEYFIHNNTTAKEPEPLLPI
jgi:PAS domain S-box-containing protein